jgi:hypothetical protein
VFPPCHLVLLKNFFLLDAATIGAGIGAFFLGERGTFVEVILNGAVELFFEDRVLVNCLEFGLEVTKNFIAAIRSTTLIGKIVAIVLRLFAISTPGGHL